MMNIKNNNYSQSIIDAHNKQYKTFDYESFLLTRQHEWGYKVKLFVYDLLFSNAKQSISIYEDIQTHALVGKLKKTLGYYDYFDCMFLLAEAYQQRKGITNSEKALQIYYEIGLLEKEISYFKTYMEEVATRVLSIVAGYYANLNKAFISILLRSMLTWDIMGKQKKTILRIIDLKRVE